LAGTDRKKAKYAPELDSKNRISQFPGSGETENVAEITKEL
jgi:hypothetical protein